MAVASYLLAVLGAMGPAFPLPQPQPGGPLPNPPQPTGQIAPLHAPDCSRSQTIRLDDVAPRVYLARGDADLGGRARWSVTARARFTKRRVIADVEASLFERGGDSRFAGFATSTKTVNVPTGCEIASISQTTGVARSPGKAERTQTSSGSGLLETVTCDAEVHGQNRAQGCTRVRFRQLRVRFRPHRRDCADVTIPLAKQSVFDSTRVYRYRNGAPIWEIIPREYGKEMGNERPSVSITIGLGGYTSRSARVVTTLRMHSDRHGVNERREREIFRTYVDAPGCKIDRVTPTEGRLRATTRDKPDHKGSSYGFRTSKNPGDPATGVLTGAYCVTDTNGYDNGRVGCGEIRLKSVTIELSRE